MKDVVNFEKATEEVTAWLDKKRVPAKEREKKTDDIESLTAAIQDGTISIDDAGVITHRLIFPLKDKATGEDSVKELTYKLRLDTATVNDKLKGLKMDMGMISAYGAALSDQPIAMINKLDTQDNKVMRAVASFFI